MANRKSASIFGKVIANFLRKSYFFALSLSHPKSKIIYDIIMLSAFVPVFL